MLQIYFDDVLIDNDYYTYLDNEYKLFDDNTNFRLGATACNTFKLSVDKSVVSSHPNEIKINDGTSTVYLIVDSIEEDKFTYTYTLVDKLMLFNFYYDASEIIEEKASNEEDCYLSDILADMCEKAGVELDPDYEFQNDIVVNWYDNRKQAREYLSYIAELQYGYAQINEDGKLTFKRHNSEPVKTIDIDECDDFVLGEGKTISRVVFDNGLVKYEFGDDTGATLYLNPNNVYITSEETVENIYNELVGFTFYNVSVPQCPIDSSVRAGDVIVFTDGINNYPTIAQYSLIYNGDWSGGYSLAVNTEKQQETQIIDTEEKIKNIQTIVDRVNNQMQIVVEETSETSSKISFLEQDVDGITETIKEMQYYTNENGERIPISTKIFELSRTADGLTLKSQQSGNNLFHNTMFYDFNDWSLIPNLEILEMPIPPTNPLEGMVWYCTQDYENYKAGEIYEYEGQEWVGKGLKRTDYFDPVDQNSLQIVDNEETQANYLSGRKVQFFFDGTGWGDGNVLGQYTALTTKVIPINQTEEYMTLSYKIKNNLEYGRIETELFFLKDNIRVLNMYENLILYTENRFYEADDVRNLTQEKIKVYNQNQKRIIYGIASISEPENKDLYWLSISPEDDTTGLLLKYDYENEMWILIDEQGAFVDINTNKLYNRASEYVFTYNNQNISDYVTKYVFFQIRVFIVYVEQSEEEPEPYKGLYWGNPVTNEIKRAIFDGDEFVGWELLDVTNDVALANAGEYGIPFLFPKGTVDFGDLKLEYGDYTAWSSNQNEVCGRNAYLGSRGLEITKDNNKMFIDEDEIKATYKDTAIFNINQDEIYGKKFRTEEFELNGVIEKRINTGTRKITVRYEV